ncbi:MAG: WbqC family protein [Saprospiraceae bacterium]|nr:WbqC family protein [Saprospiraceae bacterium]
MPDVLLYLPYLPPVSWCAAAWSAEQVTLEACEHYQKGSYRNRCYIAGPNGPQRLSIPLLQGKHQQTPIREVRIAYTEPWQRQHWRSIRTAYGSAPYWEHYADDLVRFYERKYDFLFDFNFELVDVILRKKAGWSGRFQLSEQYEMPGQTSSQHDLRPVFGAGPEQSPEWFFAARYRQVFQERTGFLPNLSILDLLFCGGKQHIGPVLQRGWMPA